MDYLYLVTLFYALYRSVRGNLRTINSFQTLLRLQSNIEAHKAENQIDIKILIPLLREQETLHNTIKIFSELDGKYELYFITTEKEEFEHELGREKLEEKLDNLIETTSKTAFIESTIGFYNNSLATRTFEQLQNAGTNVVDKRNILIGNYEGKPITRSILEQTIKKRRLKNTHVIHYPYHEGYMAHQLNYAITKIKEATPDLDNTYIVVYNADSVVSKSLIPDMRAFLATYPNANVVQQSSIFLNNFNAFNKETFLGNLLSAIALLQTRWTLAHELPRIINQYSFWTGNLLEPAHVVGHGLFIKLKTIIDVGGFPTQFINEDIALGYLLRLKGEKIYPFPILENADSPTTLKSMFTQYRTWFYGLASYPLYLQYVFSSTAYPKFKALVWAIKYYIRSILWLFLSVTWIFLMLYPLTRLNLFWFSLSVLTFWLYAPVNFFVIKTYINNHSLRLLKLQKFNIRINLATYLSTFPAYFTHSWGPIMASYDMTKKYILKLDINKNKTER